MRLDVRDFLSEELTCGGIDHPGPVVGAYSFEIEFVQKNISTLRSAVLGV